MQLDHRLNTNSRNTMNVTQEYSDRKRGNPVRALSALLLMQLTWLAGNAHASLPSAIQTDAPAAYYRFNEASGTSLTDSSGASLHGTITGAPGYASDNLLTGEANNAAMLFSDGSYATVANFAVDLSESFSIEAVVQSDDINKNYRRPLMSIVDSSSGQPVIQLWLSQNDNNGVYLRTFSDGTWLQVSSGRNINRYTESGFHIVAVRDDESDLLSLYIDGMKQADLSIPSSSLPTGNTLYVGKSGEAPWETLRAHIDELAIYNYALTPQQISSHYAAALSSGLIEKVFFDQAITYTIADGDDSHDGKALYLDSSNARLEVYGDHTFHSVSLHGSSDVFQLPGTNGPSTITVDELAGIAAQAVPPIASWDQGANYLAVNEAIRWKNVSLISASKPTLHNNDLTVDGWWYSATGEQTWNNISVTGGGRITAPPETPVSLTAQNITIDGSNSYVEVNGKGLINGTLRDDSPNEAPVKIGGSHAGLGGGFDATAANPAYGDMYSPTTFGEGGTNNSGTSSGVGGGAIRLVVEDTLTLSSGAKIQANGQSALGTGNGGSSGGSIWLQAGTLNLSTTSKISASGSGYIDGQTNYAGGGAGGWISIQYDYLSPLSPEPAHVVDVNGGKGGITGQPGTAWIKRTDGDYQTLVHTAHSSDPARGHAIAVQPIDGIDEYIFINAPVEISGDFGDALIRLDNAEVIQTGDVAAGNASGNDSRWQQGGYSLLLPQAPSWQHVDFETAGVKPSFGSDDLFINQWTYTLTAPQTWRNISVTGGGRITAPPETPVSLTAQNITIDGDNSYIEVNGKGSINGALRDGTPNVAPVKIGGSHAGLGGSFEDTAASPVYGNMYRPTTFGEGGTNDSGTSSGVGGGAIRLVVEDTLTLSSGARIQANGQPVSGVENGGSSGGSIWLQAGTLNLSTSSKISASGSGYIDSQTNYAGGGAGGWISIEYDYLSPLSPEPAHVVDVSGGKGGITGQPGTAWIKRTDGDYQTLVHTAHSPDPARGHAMAVQPIVDINEYLFINAPIKIAGDFGNALIRLKDATVTQTGDVTAGELGDAGNTDNSNSRWEQGGYSLLLPQLPSWHYVNLVTSNIQPYFGSDDLLVDQWTYTLGAPQTWRNIEVTNAGRITVAEAVSLSLTAESISISGNLSSIDASGKGELNRYLLASNPNTEFAGVGGSHGGLGGPGKEGAAPGGTRGTAIYPSEFGEGGIWNYGTYSSAQNGTQSGVGGGAIRLVADNLSLFSGAHILANGNSTYDARAGGAAGGSIWIDATSLHIDSASFIHANASGYPYTYTDIGGGGGGRIALYYDTLTGVTESVLPTKVSVSGTANGEAGTTHIEKITAPLKVHSVTGGTLYNSSVDELQIRFSKPIDPATLSPSDIQLSAGSVTSIAQNSDVLFTLSLSTTWTDGVYTLSIGAGVGDGIQSVGGTQSLEAWQTDIQVDTQPPAIPTVNYYAAIPAFYYVNSPYLSLSGTRDSDTAIFINDVQKVAAGSTNWSISSYLLSTNNPNDLRIKAVDSAGNYSAEVTIRLIRDNYAPVLQGITPDGATNTVPSLIGIGYTESETDIDLAASSATLYRSGVSVPGTLQKNASTLSFVPASTLIQGNYTLDISLADKAGNIANGSYNLVIDTTPPPAPVVDTLPAVTTNAVIQISGQKETGSGIRAQGNDVVAVSTGTTWSYDQTLEAGQNEIVLTAFDAAGNESAPVSVWIRYDDTAPGPVTLLPGNIDAERDGTSIAIAWPNYDPAQNGSDILEYHVYVESGSFIDVGLGLQPRYVVPALGLPESRSVVLENLQRNTTVYVAVVAVDMQDQFEPEVSAIGITPVDKIAPENASSLQVTSGTTSLQLDWSPSENSDGDLAGYRIFSNGTEVGSTVTESFTLSNLAAETRYDVVVKSIDADGNLSTGVSDPGVTLLANPSGLAAEALSGKAALSWNPSAAGLVKHYNIYAETSAYTDVSGKAVKLVVPATSTTAVLAGLENDIEYHIAVTAVNLSGGETSSVTPVTVTPEADVDGPELTSVQYSGTALVDGRVLAANGPLSVVAEDQSGVSSIAFALDTVVLSTDYSAPFTHMLDLSNVEDGPHVLAVTATDSLGNTSTATFNVSVALAAPAMPTIHSPADGAVLNRAGVQVTGQAAANTEVTLYVDGTAQGAPVPVSSDGSYSASVTLPEGESALGVSAHFIGRTAESAQRTHTVTLDLSVPRPPSALNATAKANGEVSLRWSTPVESVAGYHVYRADSAFDDVAAATRLTATPITAGTLFVDTPAVDGHYYYRVVSVNLAGTESEPSNQADAIADRLAPTLTQIEFSTTNGQIGESPLTLTPGVYNVTATYSEKLLAKPYLAIAPQGGVPLVVTLSPVSGSDNTYAGTLDITGLTPSGNARTVTSAIDAVGNHGSLVEQHAEFQIDAQGPEVTAITLLPGSPIDNNRAPEDPLTEVTVIVETNEASAQTPTLVPQLDGDAIGAYAAGITLQPEQSTGAGERWSGTFTLPEDAGLDANSAPVAQLLTFNWSAQDHWNNVSTRIRAPQGFQVYQGDLPPLAVPQGLTGTAIGGGAISLKWSAVDGGSGYRIYRQGINDSSLESITDVQGDDTTAFIDDGDFGYLNAAATGLQDGEYQYAVASLRQANGETSASGLSNTVTVNADSTAPDAPTNLTAALNGTGVLLEWSYSEPLPEGVSFRVYRHGTTLANEQELAGLQPVTADLTSDRYLDYSPVDDARYYYVVAQDAAGNLSALSNVVYLNADLLPVRNVDVSLAQHGDAQVSWNYDLASADGFNLYAGKADALTILNGTSLITAATNPVSFVDDKLLRDESGFAARDRLYRIEAVDDQGATSPPRDLVLPAISLDLDVTDENGANIEQALKVGVFNQLLVNVHNRGEQSLDGATVTLAFDQFEEGAWVTRTYPSEPFSLAPGEHRRVPVVVGGVSNPMTSSAEVTVTFQHTMITGESIQLTAQDTLPVIDAAYIADLKIDSLIAGAQGEVRLYVENTTDLSLDILTAESNGSQPSSDLRILVEDLDGNTLSVNKVKIFTGDVVTKVNGNTVATVAPQASYTSAPIAIDLSTVDQDEVRLVLIVDQLYHRYSEPVEISTRGLTTSKVGTTELPPYKASNVVVSPTSVDLFGTSTADVTISGDVVLSDDSAPMANAPLDLVLGINGFERRFKVTSNDSGAFSFIFKPTLADAGIYTVSAIYPGSGTRPEQAQFEVRGASVSPNQVIATWPRSYPNILPVRITSKAATTLENVVIQAPATLPDGVTVTPQAPVSVAPGKTVTIEVEIAAQASALETGALALPVMFGDGGESLGTIQIDYTLVEAKAALVTSPPFVETGLAQDEHLRQSLFVKNTGFDTALNTVAWLEDMNGAPAPAWARIVEYTGLGDIAPGESAGLTLDFAPDTTVANDRYLMKLKIKADNVPTLEHTFSVAVNQSGIGDALFHISDIYTATQDENGQTILGLAGASVELQNTVILENTYSGLTNNDGYVTIEDLPTGQYYYRVSAPGHESKSGTLWIRPDTLSSENVFLMNQLVSVSWSVEEITIQDIYHVVLTATYKTNVPAAVLKLEPKTVKLPHMKKGEVFLGELRLTNVGLIRGDNVHQTLPRSNEWYQVDFLRTPPESMEAGQVVTLPYRITALKNTDGTTDEYSSGGACTGPTGFHTRVECESECPSGEVVKTGDASNFSPPENDRTCATTSATVIGGGGSGSGGWGYSGGGSRITTGSTAGGCGDKPPECPTGGGGGSGE